MIGPLRHLPARCGLADNPALPADLLDRFVASADPELCLDLAERNDLSPKQARALAQRGGSPTAVRLIARGLLAADEVDERDPHIGLALLDAGVAAPSLAIVLAAHPDNAVREAVAALGRVPPEALVLLADDDMVEVVAAIARSPRLTGELADRLVRHPHLAVRRALASNEHAPRDILVRLRDGGDPPSRRCLGCDGSADPPPGMDCYGDHRGALTDLWHALVSNPSTPSEVAAAFVEHPSGYVRWALAHRPDLPEEAYERLADDPVPGVRGDVAANPAISERLIRSMANDRTYDVARRLAHNPSIPLDVLAAIAPAAKIGPTLLPRIAEATIDEVIGLARSPVAALRMLVAQRPDLPADVVDLLAGDPDAKVLKAIASSPAVTERQLRAMVAAHGSRVIARVARNPTCTPALLEELARHRPPVQKALREIAAHPNATATALLACLPDHQARRVAARHAALSEDILVPLLDDPDPHVAEAAAANPHLPITAMLALLDTDAVIGRAEVTDTRR